MGVLLSKAIDWVPEDLGVLLTIMMGLHCWFAQACRVCINMSYYSKGDFECFVITNYDILLPRLREKPGHIKKYFATVLQDRVIDARLKLWFTSSRFGLWEDLYCYPKLFREIVSQLSTTNASLMREVFSEHTFAISTLSIIHRVSLRRFRAAAKECETRLNRGEEFTLKTLLVKAFPGQEAVREGPRPAPGSIRSMAESLVPRVRGFEADEPKPKTAGCYIFRLTAKRGRRVRYVVLRDASEITRRFFGTENGPKAKITTTVCMSTGVKREDGCYICLDEDDDGSGFVSLPCGHYFHWGCAKEWLDTRRKPNCPLCRLPVHYASFTSRGWIQALMGLFW